MFKPGDKVVTSLSYLHNVPGFGRSRIRGTVVPGPFKTISHVRTGHGRVLTLYNSGLELCKETVADDGR